MNAEENRTPSGWREMVLKSLHGPKITFWHWPLDFQQTVDTIVSKFKGLAPFRESLTYQITTSNTLMITFGIKHNT